MSETGNAPERVSLYWTGWHLGLTTGGTQANVEYVRADIAAQDAADAERLRWLVMQPIYIELFRRFGAATWQFNGLDDARQTIDAAMQEDAAEAADDELAWIAGVTERIAQEDAE